MCNCKKTYEDMLNESFIKREPNATNHKTKLTGYGLILGSKTVIEKGKMDIDFTADYPLKKGGAKSKKTTSYIVFNFCPFCGQKYESAD